MIARTSDADAPPLPIEVREEVTGMPSSEDGDDESPVRHPGLATRFVVRSNDRALFIKATEVDWFEASRNYVVLHVQQKEYRLRATLQTLLERLDGAQFARIHKSVIVNVDSVREVQPWFGGDHVAFLHDGRQLRVSRTYARALLRPIQ